MCTKGRKSALWMQPQEPNEEPRQKKRLPQRDYGKCNSLSETPRAFPPKYAVVSCFIALIDRYDYTPEKPMPLLLQYPNLLQQPQQTINNEVALSHVLTFLARVSISTVGEESRWSSSKRSW